MRSAIAVLVVCVASLAATPSRAGIFEGYPDAIVCSLARAGGSPAELLVMYVHGKIVGGNVLYRPLGPSPRTVSIGEDGIVQAEHMKDCDGRSVDELRAEGRAID